MTLSREQRLGAACRLTDVLLGIDSVRALALFEESEVPTAVLDISSRTARLVNATWRALFGTCDAYTAVGGVDEVARTREPKHVAEQAVELGGHPAYVAATLHPIYDALGATTSLIVACTEITDEVFARRLGVGPDVLIWSGPVEGGPDYFNHRWSAYSGHGEAWQQVVHPLDVTACDAALGWAVRERGSIDVEARLSRANGDWRWHRVRFELESAGARWFANAVDIHDARHAVTERNELLARERAARASAEEANRLKDQFLGVVSHELRAPLTTMVLWEGILRDDRADPVLRGKALDAIRESASIQSRVVGDLLDVTRAIAGRLQIDLRPVDIERVVRAALEEIAPVALDKQITVELLGSLGRVSAQADETRLRQVLYNVLANAVKFTDRGGHVTVEIGRRGRSLVIAVADNGRGIEPDDLDRMFEPFSQADGSMTRRGDGLGLGLAIAKQLVELHHGTIAAASGGPGTGTTLTIVLPAGARAATPRSGLPIRRGLDLARARVLVVDDDPRVREALALLLERAGAVVETADCAETARERIVHSSPQVLVCDIAMPVEDGYTLMSGLRAGGSELAAIALTAYATRTDVERALAAGFDRHLAKPIDIDQLVASIDTLMVGQRATVGG